MKLLYRPNQHRNVLVKAIKGEEIKSEGKAWEDVWPLLRHVNPEDVSVNVRLHRMAIDASGWLHENADKVVGVAGGVENLRGDQVACAMALKALANKYLQRTVGAGWADLTCCADTPEHALLLVLWAEMCGIARNGVINKSHWMQLGVVGGTSIWG